MGMAPQNDFGLVWWLLVFFYVCRSIWRQTGRVTEDVKYHGEAPARLCWESIPERRDEAPSHPAPLPPPPAPEP